LIDLSFDCAGDNFPDKEISFLFLTLPVLASSRAFLAASRAFCAY